MLQQTHNQTHTHTRRHATRQKYRIENIELENGLLWPRQSPWLCSVDFYACFVHNDSEWWWIQHNVLASWPFHISMSNLIRYVFFFSYLYYTFSTTVVIIRCTDSDQMNIVSFGFSIQWDRHFHCNANAFSIHLVIFHFDCGKNGFFYRFQANKSQRQFSFSCHWLVSKVLYWL